MLKKKYRILISLLLVLVEEFYEQMNYGNVPDGLSYKDDLRSCATFLKEHFYFLQISGVESAEYSAIRGQIQQIKTANK